MQGLILILYFRWLFLFICKLELYVWKADFRKLILDWDLFEWVIHYFVFLFYNFQSQYLANAL